MHPTTLIAIAALAVALPGCGGTTTKDPAAAISAGADFCGSYNFDLAAEQFAAVRAVSEPGSDNWTKATFGLAVARQQEVPIDLDRVAQAARLYEEVVEKGGKSPVAALACLHRGRIAEQKDTSADTVDLATARVWYQRVIDNWRDDPVAGEASLRLAVTWIQTLEPEQVRTGIKICEDRASRPNEPWAGALWKQAGDAWWVNLGQRAEAVRCLGRSIEVGCPDPSRAASTVWRAAKLADDGGDKDAALRFYRRIIERHPNSGMAWDAQNRMRELGVEPPPIKLAVMPEETKG